MVFELFFNSVSVQLKNIANVILSACWSTETGSLTALSALSGYQTLSQEER